MDLFMEKLHNNSISCFSNAQFGQLDTVVYIAGQWYKKSGVKSRVKKSLNYFGYVLYSRRYRIYLLWLSVK